MNEQQFGKKSYLSPHTALIIIFLVLILIMWFFPIAQIKGLDVNFNAYTLMFNSDYRLDLYAFVFAFHLLSLGLALAGDVKVCKCFIIPLSIFNFVVTVVAVIGAKYSVTFITVVISGLYIAIIGTALHDITLNRE